MITIRPTFWRPGSVFWAVLIGGFCLSPVVFQAGAFPKLMGLGVLAASAVLVWLGMRRHGWRSPRLRWGQTRIVARAAR